MDYADIYYVDTRNADSRDHRTQAPPSSGGRPVAVVPAGTGVGRPVSTAQPMIYGGTVPMPYGQYGVPPYGMPPYGAPQNWLPPYGFPYGQPSVAQTLFGKLTTGQVIEMVSQIFAALQGLPGAPVATRDATTDVGNPILYQNALAQHAKRDEQVRTLGGLIAKLVG